MGLCQGIPTNILWNKPLDTIFENANRLSLHLTLLVYSKYILSSTHWTLALLLGFTKTITNIYRKQEKMLHNNQLRKERNTSLKVTEKIKGDYFLKI